MLPTETETREFSQHEARAAYIAIVSEREGTAVCTISPLPASEVALQRAWIGAEDDSFVALEAMR